MFWKHFSDIKLSLPTWIALGFVLVSWLAFLALLLSLPIGIILKVFF